MIKQLQEIILNSRLVETKLKTLIAVEKDFQRLMIKKGYKPEMVREHWRF